MASGALDGTKLYVEVVEARNLVPMDTEGAANPYIVVTLGSYKKKTRVIRTTLNPKWRIGSEAEKFKFKPSSKSTELLFTLLNFDRMKAENRMGQVKINVADLAIGKVLDGWYPVEQSKQGDAVSGEVHLILDLQKSTGGSWIANLTSHHGSSSSSSSSNLSIAPGTPNTSNPSLSASGSLPGTPGTPTGSSLNKSAVTMHPIWNILKTSDMAGLQALLKDDTFDVNMPNKYGDTPLHVAVQRTKWDDNALQLLLTLLAAPKLAVDSCNQDQNTPFHYFCQKFDHPAMLGPFNRFIERGANVNARNTFGETPMHKAIFNQSLKLGMVDMLWARGAELEIKSESGETALHYAVRLGREDMVKFLIQKGADLNAKSSSGKTPLDVAQEENIEGIATRIQDSKEIMTWLTDHDLGKYMEEFLAHDVFTYLLPDLTDDMLQKFLGDSDATERAHILTIAHQFTGKDSSPEDAKRREKLLKQLAMKKQESILRKSLTETARARILSRATAQNTQRNLHELAAAPLPGMSPAGSPTTTKAQLRVTSTSTTLTVVPSLVNKPSVINLTPGTSFGQDNEWEIEPTDLEFIKSLGQGASGEVFQGTYRGESVAIKVLKTNNTDAEVEEFKKEFSVLVSFNSPYIIRFRGACLADKLCMVMEFCPHGSLYDLLRSPDFVMTWEHFFTFAIETTAGLAVLHKAKPSILHRDMKTLNLLVDKDYHAKLCDFGLSRFNTGSNLATLSKCRGTYAYIAPEVYNCETFTTKSDVYSVAIILWELIYRIINGKYLRPFQEFKHIQFDFQVLIQACKMKLRPTLPPETPPPLEQLVKKCWHEDRDSRLESWELIVALKQLQADYRANPEPWDACLKDSAGSAKSTASTTTLAVPSISAPSDQPSGPTVVVTETVPAVVT
jgi:serine/threonine protein kinase